MSIYYYPDLYGSIYQPEVYSLTFGVDIAVGLTENHRIDVYCDITPGDDMWREVSDLYSRFCQELDFADLRAADAFLSDGLYAIDGLYEYWMDSVSVEEV